MEGVDTSASTWTNERWGGGGEDGSDERHRRSVMMTAASLPWAALIPAIIVLVGFDVFCLVDLYRTDAVRYLPRWAWAIVCLISVPLGGIIYLIVGRAR